MNTSIINKIYRSITNLFGIYWKLCILRVSHFVTILLFSVGFPIEYHGIHTFIPTRREPTIICGILHDPLFYTIFCVKFMEWLQNVNIKTVIHSPRLHQDKSNLSFLFCFKYLLILLTKAKWRNCYVFCNVPFSSGLMTCILPICYHRKNNCIFFLCLFQEQAGTCL